MKLTLTTLFISLALAAVGQRKSDSLKLDTNSLFLTSMSSLNGMTSSTFNYSGFVVSRNNNTIFTVSPINHKTGKTIIHVHKSQLRWLNDSTVVVRPYKRKK